MKNNLLKLLINNKAVNASYRIEASGDDEETVYLYDAIGGWYGIEAQQFVKDLNAITASTIHLRINSPGGDVFEARAMATAIKAHPAKIIAHVDGLAASAATYIAVSCDEVEIAKGGFFMIHNGWTLAMGDKGELTKVADLLAKIDVTITTDYLDKITNVLKEAGADSGQVTAWMDDETWFTAEEAVEHGFADRLFEGEEKTQNSWDVSAYDKAPAALLSPAPANEVEYDREHLERRVKMLNVIG